MNHLPPRRRFVKSSVFGIFAVSAGSTLAASPSYNFSQDTNPTNDLFYRYPALDDKSVAAVVGAAHTQFDKVKELVTKRPELANAAVDWGFGDWETAIGAASHMGRKDIAEFLMSYGARPDIFTFAMLGQLEAVKTMIAATPGIQRFPGPHGITLLQHAKNRLRYKDIPTEERQQVEQVVAYLASLGDADSKAKSLAITEEEQAMYIGEYRFGTGEDEIFVIKINSRKMIQMGRKGTFGRVLNRIDEQIFSPGGAPSVQISFVVKDGKAVSLTIHEPEPLVTARRV